MPTTLNPTPKYLTLVIINLALCSGVTLFLLVAFLQNKDRLVVMPTEPSNALLMYIAIALAVASTFSGMLLYTNLVNKIDTSLPVNKKFPQYLTANIVRYALLEGAALFNAVVFMLSGSLISAGIAVLLVVIIFQLRPSRSKVTDDLKINYPETLE